MSKPELVRGHNSKYKLWNSSTLLFTPSTACLGAAIGGMRDARQALGYELGVGACATLELGMHWDKVSNLHIKAHTCINR